MLERLRPLLEDRRLPWLAAGLGAALVLPSVGAGFVADDWFHRAIQLDRGVLGGLDPLTQLFTFMDGGPRNRELLDLGLMPWWSKPDILVSFFRPLAAASHILDYRLWPDTPALHHLQNLGWYAAACGVVALLLRRVHPGAPAVAGVAALLFAMDDAHAMPASWIANRNSLLTLVFGGLALLAHLRWRERGGAGALAAALAALAAGLLAGEATLGAVAYIGAWQLTADRGPRSRRLLALAPYAALIIGWRIGYSHLGYGAHGSGLYLDPGRQPASFFAALVERWPLLFAAQHLQAPVDLWPVLPRPAQLLMSAGCAGAVGAVGWLLWPALRAPEGRFWALGSCLSLVPLCAAFPMDRLLIFAGIGGAALVGMLAQSAGLLGGEGAEADGPWRRRLAIALLLLHGVVAPLALVGRCAALPLFGDVFSMGADQAPEDPGLAEQSLIFVNGNLFATAYAVGILEMRGAPAPRRAVQLTSMLLDNDVRREGDDTLVITPEGGFLADALDHLFRDTADRFAPGEVVEMADFQAEVRAVTGDGRPAQVAFRFRGGLEDPGLRLMYWTAGWELLAFEPPADGATVRLARGLPWSLAR
jgi:hypothetical protein